MISRILFFVSVLTICSLSTVGAQLHSDRGNLPMWGTGVAIDALDSLTAIIAVSESDFGPPCKLFLTTDGGTNWENRSVPSGQTMDISIVDTNHVWAVTDDGHVYSSTNGGRNWSTQFYDTTVAFFMNYIEMFSLKEGVAMGDPPSGRPTAFLRTTDGGENWNIMNMSSMIGASSADLWRRLDFVNRNVGYFDPSGTESIMAKTTDGGATWTDIPTGLSYENVLKFYDEQLGIASNGAWSFLTTDGGKSWDTSRIYGGGWGKDFEFLPGDPSKVWYAHDGGLKFSDDTGRTWAKQEFDTISISGEDVAIPDPNCAWFLCDDGQVYRTTHPDHVTSYRASNAVIP